MPIEKYLDYAGLQYYHEKLKLDLASMLMTDDSLNDILFDELGIPPEIPENWTASSNGTLDLSLGNAFSYWPEGAGTKTISIINGTTAGLSRFFLKLTDAGNFFVEWGSSIQWKNGSEPEWQAFHEDIVIFKSDDSGNTWTAQVVQTYEITPYWKITVDIATKDYGCGKYNSTLTDFGHDVYLLFGAMPGGPTIDWGDGTIETNPEYYEMFSHTYTSDGIYHIKIEYDDFEHVYAYNIISSELGYIWFYQRNIISIDSPLPHLAGSWQGASTSKQTYDNDFEGIFGDYEGLKSIPEKLFYNNPNITSLRDAFSGCPLNDFTLYISSPNIQTSLTYDNRITFCTTQTGGYYVSNDCDYYTNWYSDETTHARNSTIYAPCGSNTFKSFLSIASSHGLTIRGIPNDNTFVYTVTTDSDKKSAIPFTLYNVPNTTLCVDWGDGTTSSLTSSNYSEFNTESSVHTYASTGTYTIRVDCNNWNNVYLMQTYLPAYGSDSYPSNNYFGPGGYELTYGKGPIIPIYYWRTTITKFNSPLPHLKGTQTYIDDSSDFEDYISQTLNNRIVLQFCDALNEIPSNLFENNSLITSFAYCFEGCTALESIPENIFSNNVSATSFERCFRNCTSLQTIPEKIFSNNVSVIDFEDCFHNCTNLISIPSNLFSKNTAVTNFGSCFEQCNSLEFIPSELFSKNIAVTHFDSCFEHCQSLKLIPPNLFNYNISVTSFSFCFGNCSSIQYVPEGLFDKNTAVTNFSYCFAHCSSLQSISTGLFNKNTAVTTFYYCFYGCTSLNNFNIHIGSSSVSNCSSFVTNKTGTTRTINVPSGSTTQTNFNAVASSLGLTIVGV